MECFGDFLTFLLLNFCLSAVSFFPLKFHSGVFYYMPFLQEAHWTIGTFWVNTTCFKIFINNEATCSHFPWKCQAVKPIHCTSFKKISKRSCHKHFCYKVLFFWTAYQNDDQKIFLQLEGWNIDKSISIGININIEFFKC